MLNEHVHTHTHVKTFLKHKPTFLGPCGSSRDSRDWIPRDPLHGATKPTGRQLLWLHQKQQRVGRSCRAETLWHAYAVYLHLCKREGARGGPCVCVKRMRWSPGETIKERNADKKSSKCLKTTDLFLAGQSCWCSVYFTLYTLMPRLVGG